MGVFGVKPKRHIFASVMGGSGPFDTRILSAEVGFSPADLPVSFSILGERAQWLDIKTNTGKLASAAYGLLCAGGMTFDDRAAFSPCIGSGASTGEWKDRNFLNDIETHRAPARPVKIALLRGVFVYDLFGRSQTSDWVTGYSEDVFLYGGFLRVMTATPIPSVFAGVQTYGIQRNAVIFSSTLAH
jgi:hypothetical protein